MGNDGKGAAARERALAFIETCSDPAKLEQLIDNARAKGETEIVRAAQLRLYDVKPSSKPGTLEYDVWRSIYALEGSLTEERDRTTLLSRTRQTITREGEAGTVARLVLKREASDGFQMLLDRDMAHLTFEVVALKHRDRFEQDVLSAAEQRLMRAGLDPEELVRR